MKRAAAIALPIVALGLAGCGFGDDPPSERVVQSALLTKAQVERYPEGTPERTVFEWWRALQFDNAVSASRFYAEDLGITPGKLDGQLQKPTVPAAVAKRPKLVGADEMGDEAIVMTVLEVSRRNPNGRVDTTRQARGFNLVREKGQWKLAENNYLDRVVRVEKQFAAGG